MNRLPSPAATLLALTFLVEPGAARNLVVNGDFSAGDLSGWSVTPNAPTTIAHDPNEGQPPGSAAIQRGEVTDSSNANYLYQAIPVMPGRQYRFDARWKGDLFAGATGRNWAEVFVSFADSAAALPGTIVYKKASDGGPNEPPPAGWDWESVLLSPDHEGVPVDGVFTATDEFLVVGFNLGGRGPSDDAGPGFLMIDQVSVTAWPPDPVFTEVRVAGDEVILAGEGGPPAGAYQMLHSDDLGRALDEWGELGVAAFDPAGGFDYRTPFPGDPRGFYRLSVLSADGVPEIGEQPQARVAGLGGSVTFQVAASGLEPLEYQWFHEGAELPGEEAMMLVLDELGEDDAGEYRVRVSNLLGFVDSDPALLELTTDPVAAVPDGYATANGGTTGGGAAEPVRVASAAAFRAAVENDEPAVILVDGMLDTGDVRIGSNKTVLGVNAASGLYGGTVGINGENCILQNLLIGPPGNGGDALEISGASNVFVHKCDFRDSDDELCSIVRAADFVTVSWCRFRFDDPDSHSYAHLIGNGDDVLTDRGKLHVTLHHNWYDVGVRGRMPRVRFGHVHVFNCYYNAPDSGYCVGVGKECHIRLESCHFENARAPWADYGGRTDGELGWADLKFVNSPRPSFIGNSFPVFSPPYPFAPDPVEEVEALVRAGAGNVWPE